MSTKKNFKERPRYKLRGAQLILVLSAVFVGNALAQQNANPRADSFAPDTAGRSRAVSDLRAPGPDTDGWLYLSRNGHPSETVCRVQLRLRQQESKRHTWGTHDQIYAFAHNKLPFADQFGWRNIEDIRAGVDEKAGKEWTLTEAVADFWLARVNDATYASSGDAGSIASHPGAASSDLGSELDLIAEY